MAFSVQMPALGESVTEGTVTRWLKQEGDHVDVDEPLLEVSTDKVDTEIPSPAAGTLERIVVGEDETVEVGAELAVIGDGASGGGDSGSGDSGGEQPAPSAEEHTDESAPAEDSSEAAEPEPEPVAEPEPASAQSSTSSDAGSGSGTAVSMPALGESVTEGVVTRWLKQVGDHVDVDEPLLEVSTDKVDTEIPSPVAGTLLEISAGEDETVEVGGQLALIGDGGDGSGSGGTPSQAPAAEAKPKAEEPKAESGGGSPWREPEQRAPAAAAAPAESAPAPAAEAAPKQAEAPADTNGSGPEGDPGGSPYVTPLVRKLASEHGVDLTSVHGTGVGGRIRKQDVLAAAKPAEPEAPAAQPAAPAAAPAGVAVASSAPAAGEPSAEAAAQLRGTTQKLTRLRGVIAERMVESLQVSAQLTAVVEVDVTRVALLRQRAKAAFQAREGAKLTFLPFFVKATVDALKLFPQLNASVDVKEKQVKYHDAEHIGIAVDTEKGLIVPVLHNAGDLNLAGLARGIADLAQRTRTNKIKPDELSGGTFTISNIGSFGSLIDTPIINQPQVGILGTGAVVKRPVVITDEFGQDTIAIRSIASLVLTYDHRLVDGADAGRFLTAVKRRIETGAFETEVGL
ncbi:MAG: Dihydrolipoyllysine-residue succinyltransferase component of 2-oxoglutarate dehydrogenase complex [Pseudonocardia sp.]|nr:Dihydrolipoyllysine-residue succinyltransferase component of 2-oxoglutarate dehydrogenase complex [Pseudonocardia sp.]